MKRLFSVFMTGTALSLGDIFEFLDSQLFTPDFGTYEHLTFFNDPKAFKWLILAIYFGLLLASFMMFYNRHILGGFVRSLDREGCSSKESSKTLSELGCGKNIFVKLSLIKGYTLRNITQKISAKNPDNATRPGGNGKNDAVSERKSRRTAKSRIDFSTDKFFLLPEKHDSAIQRFRANGSGWLSLLLVAVIGLVAVILIFKIAPWLVSLLDGALNSFNANEAEVLQ